VRPVSMYSSGMTIRHLRWHGCKQVDITYLHTNHSPIVTVVIDLEYGIDRGDFSFATVQLKSALLVGE
jgi:hypothetical protein